MQVDCLVAFRQFRGLFFGGLEAVLAWRQLHARQQGCGDSEGQGFDPAVDDLGLEHGSVFQLVAGFDASQEHLGDSAMRRPSFSGDGQLRQRLAGIEAIGQQGGAIAVNSFQMAGLAGCHPQAGRRSNSDGTFFAFDAAGRQTRPGQSQAERRQPRRQQGCFGQFPPQQQEDVEPVLLGLEGQAERLPTLGRFPELAVCQDGNARLAAGQGLAFD